MLIEVKTALRISHAALDGEIEDLIKEARQDLILAGVSVEKANDDEDALIKKAIKTYAKANFFAENETAARYQKSYEMVKQHLSMAGDYNERPPLLSADNG